MKARKKEITRQPEPFTPGLSRNIVRQHALKLYRDKLTHGPLSLEDWVLAEKDLLREMETGGVLA